MKPLRLERLGKKLGTGVLLTICEKEYMDGPYSIGSMTA